jgi:hypothetical protein
MLSNFSVWFHWQRYSGELFDLVAIIVTVILADFDAKVVAVAVVLPLPSLLPLPSSLLTPLSKCLLWG